MTSIKLTTAAATALLTSSCVTTGTVNTAEYLQKYMDDNQYTAFSLPRDDWGGGTVVNFTDGKENIVYFNDQCLNLSGPGPSEDIRTANVSLTASDYKISRTAKIEASLAQGAVKDVNVKGAFNDSRVSSIKIALTAPKEFVTSRGSIVSRIRTLIASDAPCADDLLAHGNYVIERVIGVDGFAYSFETEQGQKISLDAALLNILNVAPEYSAELIGKAEMSSDTPRLIGYRLYRYSASGGLGSTEIIETRVSPAEISQLMTPQ